MSNTTAIILAAGTSSRMGDVNKMVALWKGEPVISHVVRNVLDSNVMNVIVVTGFEKEKVEYALRNYSIELIHNSGYNLGMTSSIKAGVRAAKNDVLICLGDMPSLHSNDYNKMLPPEEADKKWIKVPVYHSRRGNPIYFSEHFRNELLGHDSPDGCKEVILANEEYVKEIAFESNHVLKDIDTPSDL